MSFKGRPRYLCKSTDSGDLAAVTVQLLTGCSPGLGFCPGDASLVLPVAAWSEHAPADSSSPRPRWCLHLSPGVLHISFLGSPVKSFRQTAFFTVPWGAGPETGLLAQKVSLLGGAPGFPGRCDMETQVRGSAAARPQCPCWGGSDRPRQGLGWHFQPRGGRHTLLLVHREVRRMRVLQGLRAGAEGSSEAQREKEHRGRDEPPGRRGPRTGTAPPFRGTVTA